MKSSKNCIYVIKRWKIKNEDCGAESFAKRYENEKFKTDFRIEMLQLKFSLQTETDFNAKIGHPIWDV